MYFHVRLQTDKIGDTSQPAILRIAAASYMASFLVRAPRVCC
jgi:hypothetical protein